MRRRAHMQTRIGLCIAVMMAAALGNVRAGHPRQIRPLVQPFADTGSPRRGRPHGPPIGMDPAGE